MQIKYGTVIIIYSALRPLKDKPREREKIKASQIAAYYGLIGYPYLKLLDYGKEYSLRGVDLSKCVELSIRGTYPKIEIIK